MQAPLPPTAETTSSHPADTSSTDRLSGQYDFIIVGGGTAGLVVASRLSEDPNVQVLVLEAGANRSQDPMILTPGLGFGMFGKSEYDYAFASTPQKALNNRVVPHQRGKVLGGSSAINQMAMVFSSKGAFDAWGKLGNSGWNWDSMLRYLRKFHTHHPPGPTELINNFSHTATREEGVDSTEGQIQTSYSETGDLDKAWYESWKKIMTDLKYEDDSLGGVLTPAAIDPKTKTRSYAVTAYYSADISSRPNLRVVTEATVQKILFEKTTETTASSIEFISKDGKSHNIKTTKEIILAAGTVASPQLLELSGIGDTKLLHSHSIDVILDNPNVGENLQDHAMIGVSFEVTEGVQTAEVLMRNPEIMGALVEMYQKDRSGPLGQNFIPFAQFRVPETFADSSFIKTLYDKLAPKDESTKERDAVTIELLSQATAQQILGKFQFNISGNSKITEIATAVTPGNYATLFTSLNHPFSRGNVHIVSSDVKEAPTIDPKYMEHPMDLELVARHVQFYSTLISTAPLSKFFKPGGRRIPSYAFPASNDGTSQTGIEEMGLEQAKELVREQCLSNYHPAGTCAMLPREKGGVVDERLKVWGVKGLRVVDASIFPVMPRGNIASVVFAVAERAADLIKEDWGLKSL